MAVVEDDADARVALGRVLQAGGFEVRSYASAEDYLAAERLSTLCLVVDVQLEGMSGLDLLRALRTDGSTLPVIVVTAADDTACRTDAERLGCVAYLCKPYLGRSLVTLLKRLEGGLPPRDQGAFV